MTHLQLAPKILVFRKHPMTNGIDNGGHLSGPAQNEGLKLVVIQCYHTPQLAT